MKVPLDSWKLTTSLYSLPFIFFKHLYSEQWYEWSFRYAIAFEKQKNQAVHIDAFCYLKFTCVKEYESYKTARMAAHWIIKGPSISRVFFLRFYLNYKQCCNSSERDNFSDSYSFLFLSNNCSQINILRMYKLYLKYYYFVTDQKLYVIKYLKKIL